MEGHVGNHGWKLKARLFYYGGKWHAASLPQYRSSTSPRRTGDLKWFGRLNYISPQSPPTQMMNSGKIKSEILVCFQATVLLTRKPIGDKSREIYPTVKKEAARAKAPQYHIYMGESHLRCFSTQGARVPKERIAIRAQLKLLEKSGKKWSHCRAARDRKFWTNGTAKEGRRNCASLLEVLWMLDDHTHKSLEGFLNLESAFLSDRDDDTEQNTWAFWIVSQIKEGYHIVIGRWATC